MPPFAAAVASGVAAVMPAFMDLAGIPMTANKELLRGWLRGRWGFKGVIVSDYNAIAELMNHGIAGDLAEAAAHALKAGVDIDMMADAYRRGAIPEPDAAFAHRRQLARDVGARAIVMLKNDKAALPLIGSLRRLAVIGPLADAPAEMRGPWWGAAGAEGHVSVVAGLRAVRPDSQVLHAPGVAIDDEDVSGMAAALHLCAAADAILLCLGEAATMSGEAASRAHMGLPGKQRQFAEAVLEKARAANKR